MNKADFLEKLHGYLIKEMPENEVIDIILKYEDYVCCVMNDGLSEVQAVSMLGSPKGIAEEFLSHYNEIRDDVLNKKSIVDKINLIFNKKAYEVRLNGSSKDIQNFNRTYYIVLSISLIISSILLFTVGTLSIVAIIESIKDLEHIIVSSLNFIEGLVSFVIILTLLGFECFIAGLVFKCSSFVYKAFDSSLNVLAINAKHINVKGKE